MVLISFSELDEAYSSVRQSACESQGCTIMILVANDVDAMAATKILTHLLRQDNIAYKIRPVATLSHLRDAAAEFGVLGIKTVFMINCGAVYNMVKLFDLGSGGDMRCFILDSHRPIHLANCRSRHNVVVMLHGDADAATAAGDVSSGSDYSDQESEDDDDEEEGEGGDLAEQDDDDDDLNDDEAEEAEADFDEEEEGEEEEEEEEKEEGEGAEEEGDGEDIEHSDADGEAEDEDEKDFGGEEDTGGEGNGKGGSAYADDDGAEDGDNDGELDDSAQKAKKRRVDFNAGEESGEGQVEERQDVRAEGGGNEEEDEDEQIVGRRRTAMAAVYDPAVRRRKKLHAYYSAVSRHASSTALLLIPLVTGLNRPCTHDIMWQASLGMTDHYLRGTIADESYSSMCDAIKTELTDDVRRFTLGEGQEQVIIPGAETGVVAAGLDYVFFLYRHWSLYEAMRYSTYVCSKMEVWKSKGIARLQEMLARMGMPLQQCKQKFHFMSPELRSHFRHEIIGPIAKEFGFDDPPPVFKSFYRYNSFKNPIAAVDVVLAVQALIESEGFPSTIPPSLSSHGSATASGGGEDGAGASIGTTDQMQRAWVEAFNSGYDCLTMKAEFDEVLKKGIDDAILLQRMIVGQAMSMLDVVGGIKDFKPVRIGHILRNSQGFADDSRDPSTGPGSGPGASTDGVAGGSGAGGGSSDVSGGRGESIFSRPQVLIRLAHFLQKIQTANGKWAGRRAKPLVLAAEKRSGYIVVGVSKTGSLQTKFGKLFQKIATRNDVRFGNDAFEASIIEVDKAHLDRFLYKLIHSLQTSFES